MKGLIIVHAVENLSPLQTQNVKTHIERELSDKGISDVCVLIVSKSIGTATFHSDDGYTVLREKFGDYEREVIADSPVGVKIIIDALGKGIDS